jgi:DNA-binding MarR family transcriptional regulator
MQEGEKELDEAKGKDTFPNGKEIMHQIIHFAIKHRKVMQSRLDETGIYQAQHRLLMKIAHSKYASQKELAESMDVSTATIAVSLKKLEKGGYIQKIMDKSDNRYNQIIITEKGNQIVGQSRQIFDNSERKLFQGFTAEEKSTLFGMMQRLHANLSEMEDEIKSKKGTGY